MARARIAKRHLGKFGRIAIISAEGSPSEPAGPRRRDALRGHTARPTNIAVSPRTPSTTQGAPRPWPPIDVRRLNRHGASIPNAAASDLVEHPARGNKKPDSSKGPAFAPTARNPRDPRPRVADLIAPGIDGAEFPVAAAQASLISGQDCPVWDPFAVFNDRQAMILRENPAFTLQCHGSRARAFMRPRARPD